MNDSNVLDRMRQEWNQRAREDANYFVAFGRREQDDAEFFATGADVVRGLRGEMKRLRAPGQPPPPVLKALEIGCGPGRLMRPLSADFAEIHGIDVSDEMIRLAREKLTGIANAHVYHTEKSDLSLFADESFDFVYSYAVFQHIPSREVVFGYLSEARRVLKPGGILRCQINGLPAATEDETTWDGVRIPAADVMDFALRHDFQVLALEGVSTQYMWTTCRKQPEGWRAALHPGGGTRIRAISSALTGDQLVPASGARAVAAIWLDNPPRDCDLAGIEVRIDGRAGVPACLSAPEWDGMVQLNTGLPAGTRTGLVPVDVLWLAQPLAATAWMRVIPPGPAVPRINRVADGANLLSGTRIVSRSIKVAMHEVSHPERLHVDIDGAPMPMRVFCADPLNENYDVDIFLPDSVGPGQHLVRIYIGERPMPPVAVEVA